MKFRHLRRVENPHQRHLQLSPNREVHHLLHLSSVINLRLCMINLPLSMTNLLQGTINLLPQLQFYLKAESLKAHLLEEVLENLARVHLKAGPLKAHLEEVLENLVRVHLKAEPLKAHLPRKEVLENLARGKAHLLKKVLESLARERAHLLKKVSENLAQVKLDLRRVLMDLG